MTLFHQFPGGGSTVSYDGVISKPVQCRASLTVSLDLPDISGAFALFRASFNITQDFISRHFPLARALTLPLLYHFFLEVHKEPECNKEMHFPSSLLYQVILPLPRRQPTPTPIPNETGRLKESWQTEQQQGASFSAQKDRHTPSTRCHWLQHRAQVSHSKS